jgi:acetylornithine deacetylase
VWGRGTTDMKGFLAACVAAAAALDLRALKRPLVLIFTSNEEVGCLGAESVCGALSSILGEVPAPSLVWIGEPTSWQVQHAHKGIVLFHVSVRGIGGHSGAPEQGVNAIAVAGRVLEAIGHLQAERRVPNERFLRTFPDSPYDVLNVGTIAGGIAPNIIAEECRLAITYRSLPDAEPLEIYREIQRRLAALDPYDYASHNHRATIEVGPPMVVPPLLAPRDTTLERALLEVTGTDEVGGALFATDGGWFARAGMIPLICGPGDLDQAHKPNESIRRAALESGTEKILKVIARLIQ